MLPSEPPASRSSLRRTRVLLVDDDPGVIRGLWRIIRHHRPEFLVNTAAGASQAIDALSGLDYDVVVTDLQMPGGGGRAVLNALAAHYPETARVVHSSQLESGDTSYVERTAHVVLAKPAREAALIEAIEVAMQRVADEKRSVSSG